MKTKRVKVRKAKPRKVRVKTASRKGFSLEYPTRYNEFDKDDDFKF